MAKKYKVGVIGFGHMHINALVDDLAKHPSVEWTACADTRPAVPSTSHKDSTRAANLKRAREVTKIPRVYDDWRELLRKEKNDIIVFCTENAQHAEVAEAVAASGANMLTEKPMASSLADALRMARAARRYKVELMVNWPITWSPAVRAAKTLIDDGVIGQAWQVKWRNGASMGPLAYGTGDQTVTDAEKGEEWWHRSSAGGGALLDYCCYGACLSRWYLGQKAVAAVAMKANILSPYGDAEDNAIITVRFPKALAVLEGTWTTWHTGVPQGPVIYGSKGTMVLDHMVNPATGKDAQVVKVYTTRAYAGEPDRLVFGEPLPAGRTNLAEELIHHLDTGDPLHPTVEIQHNIDAMAILDAGIRSAASGQQEMVNDEVWCIG